MSFAEREWKAPENRQDLGFRAVGQDAILLRVPLRLCFRLGQGVLLEGST